MALFMPTLVAPKLESLHLLGACQTAMGAEALYDLLRRHSRNLVELELNVWTEDDPLVELVCAPNLRRLAVRLPLTVRWEHFAQMFPALEEVTFLYHHDFAVNSMEVIDNCSDLEQQREQLDDHTSWMYRDAFEFARDLHNRGFRHMAERCPALREIRVAVADTSFGYDVTPPEDRLDVRWRRSAEQPYQFRRDAARNRETRNALDATASEPLSMTGGDEDELWDSLQEATGAGAAVMLQIVRSFDDPSLEAELGLVD